MPTQTQIKALILKELGLEDLSEERQEEIIADLGGLIMQRVSLVVLTALPETARVAFLHLQETMADEKTMLKFFEDNTPDLGTKIDAEVKATIAEYKSLSHTEPAPALAI